MIPRELLGEWQALLKWRAREYRIFLGLVQVADGALAGFVESPEMGGERMRLEPVRFEHGELRASFPIASLRCAIADGGDSLEGVIEFQRASAPLVFVRRHPDFRRFELPRLTERGERQREYVYARPEALEDGWETSTPAAEGVAAEAIHALGESILNGAYQKQKSVLVVRNGKLCVEEYFHGSRRDHVHGIQSVTKSITSMVFGIAVDRGIMRDLDAPVHRFFAEYADRKWARERYPVSVRQLLTMSAALDWNETASYRDDENDNRAMNLSDDWIGYTLDRDLAGTPGKEFLYTSGLTILLGGILRNSSGRYVDELAREHLFEPLGVRDWWWARAPDGTRHTGGGLSVRPRDLAKLGQAMLEGGLWRGRRVLSESWVRDSTAHHLTGTDRMGADIRYGYQWWLGKYRVEGRTVESFGGRGYGGQRLEVFPELSLVVVLTADDYEGDFTRADTLLRNHILPAVLG